MRTTRDMKQRLSDLTAYDLARASVEVWWGENPKPEKYITVMKMSAHVQIDESETEC